MKNNKNRFKIILFGFLLLAIVLGIISMGIGSYKITWDRVVVTLLGQGNKLESLTIFKIRLPRIFLALVVGTALSTAGAILQGISRNDLADPGILGINTGAALAVVLFIGAGSTEYYEDLNTLSVFALPFVAILGAFLTALLIYVLARRNGIKPVRLILMGVAVNSGLAAVITFYQLNFKQQDYNRVLVWTSGSLWGSSWKYFNVCAPVVLLFLFLTLRKLKHLDILTLGEDTATGLGVDVGKEYRKLLFYVVALAGSATAVAGSIGFLGLICPHMARALVGPRHSRLIPVSAVISICIILFADTLSRNLFAPVEIPVGITIALIGVPYFIYLMLKREGKAAQ